MQLEDLVNYLNDYLEPETIKDVSVNGLQVPGDDVVNKIAVATDASLDSFEDAVEKTVIFYLFITVYFGIIIEKIVLLPLKKRS